MPEFTFEGRRVHWRERGEGPLLVLLPGSTASSAHHAGELEHFGRSWRAVALDLPGTGASERFAPWPDDWWGLGARCTAALIAHLGRDEAVLVGTSGGAVVALLTAALAPARIRGVVADSCVPRWDPEFLRRAAVLRRLETEPIVTFWRSGHGDDWRSVVAADSDLIERLGRRGGDPFDGRLAGVRCPVLLTGSLGDELLRDYGRAVLGLAAALPGCELYLVREGRHPMMWTRPGPFRRAADAFLRALGA